MDETRIYRIMGKFAPRVVRVSLLCIYAMRHMCGSCPHASEQRFGRKQPDIEKEACTTCMNELNTTFYGVKNGSNGR